MLSGVLHFIPAIQILIVILHVALNIDKSYLVLTYLLIVVSMALGILNMLHFMSDHKLRQIETFLSDQSHEDVMIKKIRKAPVSNEEKMYQTFINMYFHALKSAHSAASHLTELGHFFICNTISCLSTGESF